MHFRISPTISLLNSHFEHFGLATTPVTVSNHTNAAISNRLVYLLSYHLRRS
jgi:hypothetical protein